MHTKERLLAKSILFLAPLMGLASLLLLVIFLFNGSFRLIHLELSEWSLLAWGGFLAILFCLQHSVMIRQGLRARLATIIPSYYNDAVFTIVSSIVLTLMIVLWQTSPIVLYELHGVWRWILRIVFFLAIAGVFWGAHSLDFFDPFGGVPIRDYWHSRPQTPSKFVVRGPYRWVRHPQYFCVFLMLWACPAPTLDRFILNLIWTAWVIIGAVFEEKDLVAAIGDDYQHYQRRVPMLIPWRGRRF